ncbi:MAG: metallo-mystery pair system four-Cys motif protein [Solirubrobacterales bacterium]|nr:metallo-mystery pair system four-Cys motif protein [Solirubrobacterales bacterium]MCB8969707.1 metallo-mystery pair system four-Cys motif protein [Thermoleophilales bacterium]MCO5327199.1 metallo-mystery pair system four-Cys motif protein [Solirubrobacterales bacterium]
MELTRIRNNKVGLLAVLAAALVAASALMAAGASAKPAKKKQKVDIQFTATAGEKPVSCSKPIRGLGSTEQTADLKDLRFYVTGVELTKRNGKSVPLDLSAKAPFSFRSPKGDVTLIDLENGKGACAEEGTRAMNSHLRGKVPAGKYVGAEWTIGVPSALSHTDVTSAKAPLNLTAMDWSWQFGRKFMKIEVADPAGTDGSWSDSTFFVHLGSVGCVGNPAAGQKVKCAAPNESTVELRKFDPAKQKVAVDLKSLLAGNDVTANGGGAPGCMSGQTDPECGGVFGALGINWKTDGTGTGLANGKQSVFRAIKG